MRLKLLAVVVPFAVMATLFAPFGASATSSQSGNASDYTVVKVAPKNGGEPSIATDPTNANRVYVSWPGGGMSFYRSSDSGATWTAGAKADTQSGDTSVNVDPTGAIYQSNLNGISTNANTLQGVVYKSKDLGATWTRGGGFINSANSTNNPLLVDRQWTDTYLEPNDDGSLDTDKGLVYITYHDWGPDTMWVNVSKDGGRTFGPPVPVPSSPPPADPEAAAASAQASAASFCDTIPGGVKVVPADAPAEKHPGRAYIAWLAGDLATNPSTGCNYTQLNTFHTIWIAWSDDQGAHWTPRLVFDAGPMHDASALFADIALDNQGNPYLGFGMNLYSAGTTDMFVEASFDGGSTWNGKSDGTGQPHLVNVTEGTDATKTNVFPAIAAGDPGKVQVAYLGTATNIPEIATGKAKAGGDQNAIWYTYVAQSLDLMSANPNWTVTKVTPNPIHKGDICVLGIFCIGQLGSNRSLLDFIDIAIDNNGFSHTSYTADFDSNNSGIYVANQIGGTPLQVVPHASVTDTKVNEGAAGDSATADFTVSLTEAAPRAVSVDYATINGTADAGSDYEAASGTLTFDAGETSKVISVKVIGDRLNEADETFSLALSSPKYLIVDDELALATIQNDDLPIAFTADSPSSGQYSDQAEVKAQVNLADAAGKAVTFTLGSNSVSVLTDGAGLAKATLSLTERPGTYDLTAATAEASRSKPFTVQKENTVTTMALKGLRNGTTRVTGKLTDADSSAGIAGRKLLFKAAGRVVTRTTSSTGVATAVVKVRRGQSVVVSFGGDAFYLGSHAIERR